MLVKEVENSLFPGMQKRMGELGFRFIKSSNEYRRVNDNCIQKFYFIFFKQTDGVHIQPRWSIKIEAILNIYHMVCLKERKYFKYTPVLENSLAEIIDYVDNGNEIGTNKSTYYLIENNSDLENLVKVIPKHFEEYVLPYFNENCSVERIDKLLNKNLRKPSVHNWLYPARACMGIIAAKLVQNPEYDKIVSMYEEELEDANPDFKKEFLMLKEILS